MKFRLPSLGISAFSLRLADEVRLRAIAPILTTALALSILAAMQARAQLTTLTMDELPFQPVDGLSFMGVTFDFELFEEASTDAHYNSGGPGILVFVQDPSIEGTSSGILTLDFDIPVSTLEFGVALSTDADLFPGFIVELFDASLSSLGVFPVNTSNLAGFTEGLFTYAGAPVKRAVIEFDDSDAARFALDNLTFDTGPPPPPPDIVVTEAVVREVDGFARFFLNLSHSVNYPINFNFQTVWGSATSPADFTETAGSASIDAFTTMAWVDVPIALDTLPESDEYFRFEISGVDPVEANVVKDFGIGLISGDGLINFEKLPDGRLPADNLDIGTAYQARFGVSFQRDTNGDGLPDAGSTVRIEKAGSQEDEGDGEDSFFSQGTYDVAREGLEYLLGDFFIKGEGMIVVFDPPVEIVAGQLWDIDGYPSGTEQWRVEAMGFDFVNNSDTEDVLLSRTSPLGDNDDLDGRPWQFTFDTGGEGEIHALRFVFIGSKEGDYNFSLDNLTISAVLPSPPASVGDVVRKEADLAATFRPRLDYAVDHPVSFSYQTGNGSAAEPGDYTAVAGNVVIPAGELEATVDAPLVSDETDELDEEFYLRVSNATAAAAGKATIYDEFLPAGSFQEFCSAPLTINASGKASPYPSEVTVSGVTGVIDTIRVVINGFTHPFPDDVDMLLVGPRGQKIMLMSDAGGSNPASNLDLAFVPGTRFEGLGLSDNGDLTPGVHTVSDFETGDSLPYEAPLAPYANDLGVLMGSNPAGVWKLYVGNDEGPSGGAISSWCLQIVGVSIDDPDGDGASTQAELAAGTNPNDPGDFPGPTPVLVPEDSPHRRTGVNTETSGETGQGFNPTPPPVFPPSPSPPAPSPPAESPDEEIAQGPAPAADSPSGPFGGLVLQSYAQDWIPGEVLMKMDGSAWIGFQETIPVRNGSSLLQNGATWSTSLPPEEHGMVPLTDNGYHRAFFTSEDRAEYVYIPFTFGDWVEGFGIVGSDAPEEEWGEGAPPESDGLDPLGNEDGDLLNNLLEYAFNFDPNVPDGGDNFVLETELNSSNPDSQTLRRGLPFIDVFFDDDDEVIQARLRIRYLRRRNTSDLVYAPLISSDLLNWTSDGLVEVSSEVIENLPWLELVEVHYMGPTPPGQQLYGRVMVELLP